jgi:hypothetical protein
MPKAHTASSTDIPKTYKDTSTEMPSMKTFQYSVN